MVLYLHMNKGNFIVQLAINIATWIAFFSMNNASFRDSALSLGEIGGANGLPVFYAIPLVIIFIFAVYDVYKIAVVQASERNYVAALIINFITLLFFGSVFALSYNSPVI